MMNQDFGSSHPRANPGEPWGVWQAILINDLSRGLVRAYLPPSAFEFPLETEPPSLSGLKWHQSEWSNHPHFAAATHNADRYFKTGDIFSNTAYQERIYLINLRDSSYLEVLRPDTLRYSGRDFDTSGWHWPWLWVEVPPGFEESPGWLEPRW